MADGFSKQKFNGSNFLAENLKVNLDKYYSLHGFITGLTKNSIMIQGRK